MKNENSFGLHPRLMTLIIAAIALFFIGFIALTTYWSNRSDIYIVPYGFKGKVTVFFNQGNGVPDCSQGDRRVFKIPANGILYTQSLYKKKWGSYYYTQPDGKLQELMNGSPYAGRGMVPYSSFDSVWVEDVNTDKVRSGNITQYQATFTVMHESKRN